MLDDSNRYASWSECAVPDDSNRCASWSVLCLMIVIVELPAVGDPW